MDVPQLIEQFRATPFHTLVGMDIESLEKGRSCVVLPIKEIHTNIQGITHGGIIASLCDSAMGMAVCTLGSRSVTIEMNLNFLGSSKAGDTLVAEGTILKAGKTFLICEAVVREQDRLVAKSRGTFYIKPA